MRILFLDHPQHTHGTSMLHQALGRVLGWDSVVDFPFKGNLREDRHQLTTDPDYQLLYEVSRSKKLPQGIPPFAPGENVVSTDYVLGGSHNGHHHRIPTQRRHSWDEVVASISSFDLIILGNSHRVPTLTLALLRDKCGRKSLPPIVYFDAGERDELNAHWWHVFRPEMTFKQILTPAVAASQHPDCVLHALPLANPFVTDAEAMKGFNIGAPKVRDILFYHGITWDMRDGKPFGRHTWPPREDVIRAVQDWVQENQAVGHGDAWENGASYFSGIASSLMALSIRGSGRDTTRYWEIPALETLLVADGTMGCAHPFPFRDGETAAFYTSLEELKSKLSFYRHNEEARQSIVRASRSWVERYHSFEARGLLFLGLVRKQLGVKYTDEQQQRVNGWLTRLDWSSELPEQRSGPVVGYEP